MAVLGSAVQVQPLALFTVSLVSSADGWTADRRSARLGSVATRVSAMRWSADDFMTCGVYGWKWQCRWPARRRRRRTFLGLDQIRHSRFITSSVARPDASGRLDDCAPPRPILATFSGFFSGYVDLAPRHHLDATDLQDVLPRSTATPPE